jgi:hypothetical protein
MLHTVGVALTQHCRQLRQVVQLELAVAGLRVRNCHKLDALCDCQHAFQIVAVHLQLLRQLLTGFGPCLECLWHTQLVDGDDDLEGSELGCRVGWFVD